MTGIGWRAKWLIVLAIALSFEGLSYSHASPDRASSPEYSSLPQLPPGAEVQPGFMDPEGDVARHLGEIVTGPLARPVGYAARFVDYMAFDLSQQFASPFQMCVRRPGWTLLGVTAIAGLIATDHASQPLISPQSEIRESGFDRTLERVSAFGGGRTMVPLTLGFATVGIVARSPRERETSVMLLEAVLTSQIWADLLKSATGRPRPRVKGADMDDWQGLNGLIGGSQDHDFRSFPSGHSAGAWAAATVLAHQYDEHWVVSWLAYGTAAAIGYSRIGLDAHYLSDVVVGGLIGYGCARQVLSAHHARAAPAADAGSHLGLDLSSEYKGVSLRYDF